MAEIKHSNATSSSSSSSTTTTASLPIQTQMPPTEKQEQQHFHSSKNPRSSIRSNKKISPPIKEQDQEPISHLKTTETVVARNFSSKLFLLLFYLHLFLTTILIIFFTVHSLTTTTTHHFHFRPLHWYPPLLTSSACAAITAFLWQCATRYNPSKTLKAAFWLSPSLTFAVAILLLSIGNAGSFSAAAFALIFALFQSLYACWVVPRVDHANQILSVSLSAPSLGATSLLAISLLISTIYSCLTVSGIGSATNTHTRIRFLSLFVFVFLFLSLAWTMHVIRNVLHVAISREAYMYFTRRIEIGTRVDFSMMMMGSVCLGSVLEPIIGFIWGSARAMSSVAGDTDEFMFSCADCYAGVAERIVAYGNRWGFVHVGVYGKGFVRASVDTWEMFERVRMKSLIESELTESFCFMCGSASGSLCTLVAGSWALAIDKSYATQLSICAFFIGYFTSRIGMTWPQACVCAYHVAYAENPQSLVFDSTIPDRIQELQRSQV